MENLRNRWEGVALKSALALEQIGREAVPSLLGALRDERRGAALQVLTGMGPEAEGAVPALMELLAEEPCNPLVPPALVSIGPPAVPALRESVLKGILGSRRELAFAILATMDSRHGLPVLVEAAGDEDQWTALTALKLVAKAPADELAAVRVLAESMLRKYEKHHQQTLQKRSGFRDVASGAFRRMGRDAVPALTVVLREGEARSRHGAASALGTIGPQAWKAMPELIEALEDEDADVRAAAATSLAQVAQDKGVKAELTKLLAEESSEVQKTVQSALDAMEKSEE
jgi:HEAT repeat protein